AATPLRQIPQAIADRHDFKLVIRKGKILRIATKKTGRAIRFLIPRLGDIEHRLAKIQSHNIRARLREEERNVPRAAADIQGVFARLYCVETDQLTFPEAMQPEALEIV